MTRRHERPIRRRNSSGDVRWMARWTDRGGRRHSAGTYALRGPCREPSPYADCCAQHAIDAAYDRDEQAPHASATTVSAYAAAWLERHPRAKRTNTSYSHRVGRVLDVKLDGRRFADWRMGDVRRRQVNDLITHLLVVQGRARVGAVGVLRVLSAMWQDAIADELCDFNPFMGVKIKTNDLRVSKPPRAIRVYSWVDMHRFAAAAATVKTGKAGPGEMDAWRAIYAEAMVRALSDAGLRLGELLALERRDVKPGGPCDEIDCGLEVAHLHVRRTAHEGVLQDGTKTDHGRADGGRIAPLALALSEMLVALPRRIDTRGLFPTPRGYVWREGLFYRDLWRPTQEATGLNVRPHEMRHSWVTLMRAAGISPDDLAKAAGHTVATQHARYTHPQGMVDGSMNEAVGQ